MATPTKGGWGVVFIMQYSLKLSHKNYCLGGICKLLLFIVSKPPYKLFFK